MMRRVESPVAQAPPPAEGKRTPKPKQPKGASPEPPAPKPAAPAKLKVNLILNSASPKTVKSSLFNRGKITYEWQKIYYQFG